MGESEGIDSNRRFHDLEHSKSDSELRYKLAVLRKLINN